MPAGGTSTHGAAQSAFLRSGGCYFRIEVLGPAMTEPDKDYLDLTFPAFIDSIEDSFSPSWGKYNDMGRGDPKVMLESYGRTISINFKVVGLYQDGFSPEQPSPGWNYTQLNSLSRAVTPHYVDDTGFVGRFIRFNLARVWLNEYGYIENMNVSISNETPWQVDPETGHGEWPIVANVSIVIGWIGDMRPDSSVGVGFKNYNTELSGRTLISMAEMLPTPPLPPLPNNPIPPLPNQLPPLPPG